MPVSEVDSWPAMRPMAEARRNGTRIMVAFRAQRPGYAPFHSIARWCTPADSEGQPIGRENRKAIEKYGGYWTSGKGDKVIKNTPLGWWNLPPIDAE